MQDLLTTAVNPIVFDLTDREHLVDEVGTGFKEDAPRSVCAGPIPIAAAPRLTYPGSLTRENHRERAEDAGAKQLTRRLDRGVVTTDETDPQTNPAPPRFSHDPFVVLPRRGKRLFAKRMPSPGEDLLKGASARADRDGDKDDVHIGTILERPEDVWDVIGRGHRPGAGHIRIADPRDPDPAEAAEDGQVVRLHDIARSKQAHPDHALCRAHNGSLTWTTRYSRTSGAISIATSQGGTFPRAS
jgi:hypothetical protein